MRIGLVLISLFLATSQALAQNGPVLEPGTRVRATVPSDVLPPDGGVFVGTLVSVGDTLVIQTESGAVTRLTPDMLVGLDVSDGPPSLPYWMPAAGAGLGLAVGVPLALAVVEAPSCAAFCVPARGASNWKLERGIVIGGSATIGLLLGAVVARAQSREQWRPARRVRVAASPGAVSLRVAL